MQKSKRKKKVRSGTSVSQIVIFGMQKKETVQPQRRIKDVVAATTSKQKSRNDTKPKTGTAERHASKRQPGKQQKAKQATTKEKKHKQQQQAKQS